MCTLIEYIWLRRQNMKDSIFRCLILIKSPYPIYSEGFLTVRAALKKILLTMFFLTRLTACFIINMVYGEDDMDGSGKISPSNIHYNPVLPMDDQASRTHANISSVAIGQKLEAKTFKKAAHATKKIMRKH